MTETIRAWTIEDVDDVTITLTMTGRPPLIMVHEPGMNREVLLEYATTRVLEAELRDAGASIEVKSDGTVSGNPGTAPKALIEAYRTHVLESRDLQELREKRRRREAARDGKDGS